LKEAFMSSGRPRAGRGIAVFTAVFGLVGAARAAEPGQVAQLESRLEEALKSIERLSARVQELEARLATRGPGEPPSGAQVASGDASERLAALERDLADIAAARAASDVDRGLPLHGFADVVAGTRNPINPDLEGAAVGSLDFYLTPQLSARTRALFELNTKVGITGAVTVDLERIQLGYQLADATTLWFGRFHTPYGYYNTAYHHGQQIATSLRRPRVVEFERTGGVLPAHTVGVWLAGGQRTAWGRLNYDLYVGNAQRIGTDAFIDTNNAGTPDGDLIVGGNVALTTAALSGLRVGASAFTVKVEDALLPANLTRVNSFGLYALYDTDRWESFVELYSFDNEDLSGATGRHRSDMGFAQLGYRTGRYTPYVRYERASFEQADNFFAAQRFGFSYYREALGLRYDLDVSSALKLELARTHVTDRVRESYEEALMQYAIRF
jgi:hypothetical protein